ncbi:MAG: DUF2868 domain-containing protein [Desulfobulbus sp.]|nr:DUF2868 domain-containing protein [Desulfobulbus sp.]
MARRWNIADLIDLRYFFQIDAETEREEGGEAALSKRDRTIYLAEIEPKLSEHNTSCSESLIIREWLSSRRQQYQQANEHTATPLPGSVWQEFSLLSCWLILITGLITGISAAGSLLLYSGTAPLNVTLYFGLFVILQIMMLGTQGALFLYRRLHRQSLASSVLYRLINTLLIRLLTWMYKKVQPRLTGRQRLEAVSLAGGFYQHKELATLLIWPGFIFLQLGGIGFNLGVIAATLVKVTFFDIAFAWQSSLQLPAESIAAVVRFAAFPWSWLFPAAVPGLEQIQGSQMILKEGIEHLDTAHLISWWPFLVCAVAVYGLLPRCILLIAGIFRQRQAAGQHHFNDRNSRRLLLRMTTPRLDTQSRQGETDHQTAGQQVPLTTTPADRSSASDVDSKDEQWYGMIPDELYSDEVVAALGEQLRKNGIRFNVHWYPYDGLDTLQPVYKDEQAEQRTGERTAGVFLLQEAWQPPLKETEQMLRNLRLQIGPQKPITLLLIGRPVSATVLTPVDPQHLQVWTKKMRSMGDSFLMVQPLIQS